MLCWKIAKSLLIGLSITSFYSVSWARTLTDATNTQVKIVDVPKRIVTLAPSLGELVADVLGTDLQKIVGVSNATNYPPGLKAIPTIGDYHHFNIEKVVALKPDLVLATLDGNPRDEVLHLRELKIPVVVVRTENFDQILESIQMVALACGNPKLGEDMAAQLKRGVARIQEKSKSRVPSRVLLQVGDSPIVVVGRKSFLNQTLDIVGAKNVYSDLNSHYPHPSVEDVIYRDPDMILVLELGEDMEESKKSALKWLKFSKMKAVLNHRVKVLKNDALLRPTLRILEGLALLERTIYGQ